jgi:glucose-6-phosphate isomerase
MTAKKTDMLTRSEKYTLNHDTANFSINFADMNFTETALKEIKEKLTQANQEMRKIEAGEIKNPDENRKVTHFSDRVSYPHEQAFKDVEAFSKAIKEGEIKSSTNEKFEYVIINGIGGSALGPQLMQFSVNGPYWNELSDKKRNSYPKLYFLDNTDPAGVHDVNQVIELNKTLMVNISKSGGTQETKNNIIAFEAIFKDAGIEYAKHACAITMEHSHLDKKARNENWLKIFPMAESIGGRTSETSIVGHLPAALAGIDFKEFLEGACEMDVWTRKPDYMKNPAYLLAAMWYIAGNGKGDKNMVIVPYSDRLVLLSKYLQQLVMESLGKEKDLDDNVVHQGLTVFGNKGGTDAHAYIQQLNDGRNDFFITFIEVLKDAMNIPIAEGITMGDYLHGFQFGLSSALKTRKRNIIKIQIDEVTPYNLGMLIALYERAVAVYAELIHINAFHQPGVQAYKLASKGIIQLTVELEETISKAAPWEGTVSEFCITNGLEKKINEVDGLLAKFAENNSIRNFKNFSIKRTFKNSNWYYIITK